MHAKWSQRAQSEQRHSDIHCRQQTMWLEVWTLASRIDEEHEWKQLKSENSHRKHTNTHTPSFMRHAIPRVVASGEAERMKSSWITPQNGKVKKDNIVGQLELDFHFHFHFHFGWLCHWDICIEDTMRNNHTFETYCTKKKYTTSLHNKRTQAKQRNGLLS